MNVKEIVYIMKKDKPGKETMLSRIFAATVRKMNLPKRYNKEESEKETFKFIEEHRIFFNKTWNKSVITPKSMRMEKVIKKVLKKGYTPCKKDIQV